MDQKRPWYKKKRFLIPLGLVGLFTVVGLASSNPTPAAVQDKQQSTNSFQQTSPPPDTSSPLPFQLDNNSSSNDDTSSTDQTASAPNGTYTNVDGDQIPSPYQAPTKPAGATARCVDGSYSSSTHRQGTCSHHGGVAVWY